MMTEKRFKRTVLFALCAILTAASLFVTVFADTVTKVDGVFVYDEADVIPSETEADINERAKALKAMTGSQIMIVTVQNMDGKDGEKFSAQVFDDLKLSAGKNNSVLILFSVTDGHYHIVPGPSISGDINVTAINEVFDAALVPETSGKYDVRLKLIFDDLLHRIEKVYSVDIKNYDPNAPVDTSDEQTEENSGSSVGKVIKWILIIVLIIAAVIAGVVAFLYFRRTKYVGSGNGKRRRYNTNGKPVGVSGQSDLDRARRQAMMRQQAAQGEQGQFRYPDGQRPQGQRPNPNAQRPQAQRTYPQGQPQRPYPQGQGQPRVNPNAQRQQNVRQFPQGQNSRPMPNGQQGQPTREFTSTQNINVQGQRPTPNGQPTREFISTQNFPAQGARQYPQGQRPYPNAQPQGQRRYPQVQGQTGNINAGQPRRDALEYEHPTVYPDRAPYVNTGDSAPTDTTND